MTNTESFILDLYRKSRELSPSQFKPKVFNRLKNWVYFDSALWMEAVIGGHVYEHSTFLFNQPREMMENYVHYADQDFLAARVMAAPGRVINPYELVSRKEFYQTDLYQKHVKKYSMDEALSIAFPNKGLGIFSFMSLYRKDRANPFSLEDVEVWQSLAPHMVEAYNNSVFLSATLSLAGGLKFEGTAIVNRFGFIHFSTDTGS